MIVYRSCEWEQVQPETPKNAVLRNARLLDKPQPLFTFRHPNTDGMSADLYYGQ